MAILDAVVAKGSDETVRSGIIPLSIDLAVLHTHQSFGLPIRRNLDDRVYSIAPGLVGLAERLRRLVAQEALLELRMRPGLMNLRVLLPHLQLEGSASVVAQYRVGVDKAVSEIGHHPIGEAVEDVLDFRALLQTAVPRLFEVATARVLGTIDRPVVLLLDCIILVELDDLGLLLDALIWCESSLPRGGLAGIYVLFFA